MTGKELTESVNKGWAFEAQMSLLRKWKRDGRSGSYDLAHEGLIYECKFFTIKPASKGKHAEYNSAHGFMLKPFIQPFHSFFAGHGKAIIIINAFTIANN